MRRPDVAARRIKRILIIAGPNGAGKTTFAMEFLPRELGVLDFINADAIAAGLSPLDPSRAAAESARIMIRTIRGRVGRGESFALETTLAGSRYSRLIPIWRRSGYRVGLVFLSLPSPEIAISRVASRVRLGGHRVPESVIRRRFESGQDNFERVFRFLVDDWWLYDNAARPARLIESGTNQ